MGNLCQKTHNFLFISLILISYKIFLRHFNRYCSLSTGKFLVMKNERRISTRCLYSGNVSYFCPPLTPALSPRWGEREHYQGSFFIPSPPMGERVRVRGNNFAGFVPFTKRYCFHESMYLGSRRQNDRTGGQIGESSDFDRSEGRDALRFPALQAAKASLKDPL